jgi:hypothetical protein
VPGRKSSNCRLSNSEHNIKNNIYNCKIARLLKRVSKLDGELIIKIIGSLIPLEYSKLVSKGFKSNRRKCKSRYIARGRGSKAGDFERMSKKINIAMYNIIK